MRTLNDQARLETPQDKERHKPWATPDGRGVFHAGGKRKC